MLLIYRQIDRWMDGWMDGWMDILWFHGICLMGFSMVVSWDFFNGIFYGGFMGCFEWDVIEHFRM